jgi:pimeloyl-ACP methyl ester carboxylesterase
MAQVNDIAVYYEIRGRGTPLVLIGGLGADTTLHKGIIEGLAQRHQVLAFDNRGAGRSDKPDADYTITMMAHDTVGLMNALSIHRAHVLGISMGGRIALEIALSHPHRVDKLILVSTSAAGRGKVSMSIPMRLLTPLQWIPVLRGKYPQPRYAHLRQRQATVSYNATDRLSQLHAPTLILHGRRDRSIPLDLAEQMRAGIAGSLLEVFHGGHMFCFLTERQQFLCRVEQFLAG